jgi:uncharacterized DUF497 family protein
MFHSMPFAWDAAKNAENIRKHGIPFEVAVRVFEGPTLERVDDREDYGEERWLATGQIDGRIVTVAYTERGEVLRPISARKATTH